MDDSYDEQESHTQQDPKRFLVVGPPILGKLIKWLAGLIQWTEEEQENAGIYVDRLGGE
jgi:hypothetical protein